MTYIEIWVRIKKKTFKCTELFLVFNNFKKQTFADKYQGIQIFQFVSGNFSLKNTILE